MSHIALDQQDFIEELKPLFCGSCGATVPLGNSTTAICSYCKARVAVPQKYRRGQVAQRNLEIRRTRAAEFYESIGSQPSEWQIMLTKVPVWMILIPYFILAYYPARIINYLIFLPLKHVYASFFSLNLVDVVSVYVIAFFIFLSVFLLVLIPIWFYFRVRRKVFVARRLLSALAAGVPTRQGGPATCRRCGASLLTEDNHMVATCNYCATENFLNVPEVWLSDTRKLSIHTGRNIFWARREYNREMRSAMRSLKSQCTMFFIVGLCCTVIIASINAHKQTAGWPKEVSGSRQRMFASVKANSAPEIGKPFEISGWYRRGSNSKKQTFSYVYPLQAGEQLRLALVEGEPITASMHLWTDLRSPRELKAPEEAFVRAHLGGWYALEVTLTSDHPGATIIVDLIK